MEGELCRWNSNGVYGFVTCVRRSGLNQAKGLEFKVTLQLEVAHEAPPSSPHPEHHTATPESPLKSQPHTLNVKFLNLQSQTRAGLDTEVVK